MPRSPIPPPPRPPDAPRYLPARAIRRPWEYTTLSSERPLTTEQLNQYSIEGWELVSVYVRMDAVHAVFKREVV